MYRRYILGSKVLVQISSMSKLEVVVFLCSPCWYQMVAVELAKMLLLPIEFLPSATKLRRLCFHTCLSVHGYLLTASVSVSV